MNLTPEQFNALGPSQVVSSQPKTLSPEEFNNLGKATNTPQTPTSPFNPNYKGDGGSQFVDPKAPASSIQSGTSVGQNFAQMTGFSKDSYAPIPDPIDTVKGMSEPALKGLATGVRAVQSVPDLAMAAAGGFNSSGQMNNPQALQNAQDTMAKPLFGQKTLTGDSTGGNLMSAVTAGSYLLGGKAANKVTTPADQKALQDTLNYVKPVLSKAEELGAKESGRVTTQGLLRKVVVQPTVRELEMAKTAQGVVDTSKDAFTNIQNVKNKIATMGDSLSQGLKDNGAIYNGNQIKATLNRVEPPVMISSDATLNSAYAQVKNKMLNLVGKGGKLSDLLQSRKEFDAFVDKQFPNMFEDTRLKPMNQAVKDIRNAVNSYIERRLPNGNLPDGTSFSQSLRQQNLLYDVKQNIAEKAPKVGSNIITRTEQAIKAHPIATGLGTAIAGYGALKKFGH